MRWSTGTVLPGLFVILCVSVAGCSSCNRPAEPVLPADLTGNWKGGYTVYDGAGRPLSDTLHVSLVSDADNVSGEGVRRRFVEDRPPSEAQVVVSGSVVATSFRLEFGDPETGHTAVFSGTVEDDTLKGNLTVGGNVVGVLALSPEMSGTDNDEESADGDSGAVSFEGTD